MYRQFLDDMMEINPNIVIGGLTATPYRMKGGLLTEGENKIFDDICHETSVKELIEPNHYLNRDNKQYLCTLLSKGSRNKVDLSNVHIRGGEYKQDEMQQAFIANDLVKRAIDEMLSFTNDRKKILIFAAGIEHGEEISMYLNSIGIKNGIIHSKQDSKLNDEIIQDFKDGQFRFLINRDMMTTGFNEKRIDCIVLLRSTMSPGLFYQMVGRGLRMHTDKTDCLILDFGRNIERHGPIDKIEVRKQTDGKSEIGGSPTKECPECLEMVHAACRFCPVCNYEFIFESDPHEDRVSNAKIISEWQKPEEYEVKNVTYSRHSKKDKPDSLRVDFHINDFVKYSQWVCIEHEGFARKKAMEYLKKVTPFYEEIFTVSDALELSDEFRQPTAIILDTNGKFPEIKGHIFGEIEKKLEKILEIGLNECDKRTVMSDIEEKSNELTEDEVIGQLLF
jgi:DNA repair protein RadD